MLSVAPTAESTQLRTAVVALERPDYAASIASCVASQVRPVFPAAAAAPSVNVTDALSVICRLSCAALWPQLHSRATMRSPLLVQCSGAPCSLNADAACQLERL